MQDLAVPDTVPTEGYAKARAQRSRRAPTSPHFLGEGSSPNACSAIEMRFPAGSRGFGAGNARIFRFGTA